MHVLIFLIQLKDVLDSAFAPGTGTAEVGGWSSRELLSILDGLEGLEVVGADVGESLNPKCFPRWKYWNR